MFLDKIINQLDKELPTQNREAKKASLLAMVGLPGSGKSSIVRQLQQALPCVVISTDGIRKKLLAQPTYSNDEVKQVYDICRGLIERRLLRGQRIVFDASNYSMARRNRLRELASRTQAVLTFCRVSADEATIAERLEMRMSSQRDAKDMSEAGWPVYQWMSAAEEPIQGEYLEIDTTRLNVEEATQRLLQYWRKMEARA